MPFQDYCELPTPHGTFRMYDTGNEMLRVVTFGDIAALGSSPIIRLHSSCLASEVFGARDCDCADQLRETMKVMAHEGGGIIFHLHQEGRGQGLSKKIKAVYKMQAEGLDTAESFEAMGLEQDIRDYTPAIEVLKKASIEKVRLVSNNPRKKEALRMAGIEVELLSTHPKIRSENADYLKSKNEKLGHSLPIELTQNTSSPINFYHSDQAWGEFSNFSRHSVFLQNKIWPTVEHFYQANKFLEPEVRELIRLSEGPMVAKELARKLEKQHVRSDWNDCKVSVMWEGLFAKFTQHPELKEMLLSTAQRTIAEHTRNDSYWGDGGDGSGLNKLGKLLEKLRTKLLEESKLCAE